MFIDKRFTVAWLWLAADVYAWSERYW
jgi:hypothetical protein